MNWTRASRGPDNHPSQAARDIIMAIKPLILAQLGCGYWGPNLLRSFSALTQCRVKYLVEFSPERRAFVQTTFPSTAAVESADVVWKDSEVDGVIIATPAATHFQLAMQALQSGKHVFV